MAVDITNFYRPRLVGWLGKAFNTLSGKAVKGIAFGLIAAIGSVEQQRLALPGKLLGSRNEAGCERALKKQLLTWLAGPLGAKDIAIFEAGFKLAELQGAGLKHYVLRQASNCTASRNDLPSYKGGGARPKYGALLRPLPRSPQGNCLRASLPAESSSFELEGRIIQVQCWHKLIGPDQKPSERHARFSLRVFHDPLYHQPLVLAVSLP